MRGYIMSNNAVSTPFLRLLHETSERDGRLTRDSLGALADSLGLPISEVYRAATFYHYLDAGMGAVANRSVCSGPVCAMPGIVGSEGNAPTISCPGLCDQPVAEHRDGTFLSLTGGMCGATLPERVETEEALFEHIRVPGIAHLETYAGVGGYGRLLGLVQGGDAVAALEALRASNLVGRGGAAFPLAAKLAAVRDAEAWPKYVVCNADEGEPGTFKDRPLLHLNPHLVLEAMAIVGYLTGVQEGIIYLRYEYPEAERVLTRAIGEAEQAGLLGGSVGGSAFQFRVVVRRGAGSYVCGEETALLNSLEGRVPWPRERPPFPVSNGLWGKPTMLNNVETLCQVPGILERGASWFHSLGRNGNAGTKVYSVSGKVRRPGNYELPLGTTARELLVEAAGGPMEGRSLKGFTLGGISGGLLGIDMLDLPLDYTSPRQHGASLGSGGLIALDDDCCVVDFVRTCAAFYEEESCGKCLPCRVGTVRMRELLDGLTGRVELVDGTVDRLREIGDAMSTTSACGLGQSAPMVAQGMLRWFREEVEDHLAGRRCTAGVCSL